MSRTLYIGNLPLSATHQALAEKLAPCGTVISIRLLTEPSTGLSKGTAFVEMSSSSEAQTVVERLNLSSYDGRLMSVNKVRAVAPS